MSYSDFKDQVLQAVPIEVYIGRYVSLKKAGNTLKGLCPFHSEKTPSFTVNPEKGFYHCFGCGRGGDLFRFVMEYEKVPFPEALELLGRFAGLERPSSKKQQNDPLQKLFELNQSAMQHFTGFLRSADGRPYLEYLQKREIDADTIRDFQLGAAPEEWDWLLKRFPESSWNDLIRLGLLKQGKENRKPYDFFRGRVVFPILDLRDRVIAFGGRVLPGSDNPAKYMNSPDSPLFHKSRVLYGLHRAAAEIRGKGRAILVEGYVDVIGLARAGWGNAVAPLGTALTSDHLQLLGRYTSSIVCLFDGDVAGRNAALRFARLVIENPQSGNLNANIVLLPPGLDPFDLARNLKFQENRVGEHLELSVTVARYFLYETMFPGNFAAHLTGRSPSPGDDSRTLLRLAVDYYSGKTPDWYPRGMEKRPALERLLETLGALQAGPNQHFLLEEAARILGLNPTELVREFSSRRVGQRIPTDRRIPGQIDRPRAESRTSSDRIQSNQDPTTVRLMRTERNLLLEILLNPALVARFHQQLGRLEYSDPHSELLWRFLEARFLTGNIWSGSELRGFDLPADTMQVFIQALMSRSAAPEESRPAEELNAVMEDLLLQHERHSIQKKIAEIRSRYDVADSVERSYLIEEEKRYTDDLQRINTRLRGGDPQRKEQGGHKT